MLAGPGGDLLSHALRRSTMGAVGFHGRVREGIGWFTHAVTTRSSKHPSCSPQVAGGDGADGGGEGDDGWQAVGHGQRPGVRLPLLGSRSIERLGPVSCARCRACTPGLSTWWSATALIARPGFEEGFPLRCLQRLSRPNVATRLCRWRDNRSTRGSSTPVLSY